MGMFGGGAKARVQTKLDTMVGANTEVEGDIKFSGLLVVDGKVKGNITAEDESGSMLHLNKGGCVEGEIRVPNMRIDGEVVGDVYACEAVDLANHAHIKGNVFYNLLEMAMGAAINGNLVHRKKGEMRLLEHKKQGNKKPQKASNTNTSEEKLAEDS